MSQFGNNIELPVGSRLQDFHDLLMNSPLGVFTTTPQGRYIFANPAQAFMLGYDSPEELIKSITDISTQVYADPADREEFKSLLESQNHMINHECRFRRRDGTEFWIQVNARAVKDRNGIIVAYQGFNQDVTERRQTREALEKREEEYRELFENAPVGIFQTTPEGRLISVNSEYARIFGYETPAEMMSLIKDISKDLYVQPKDRERYKELLRKQDHVRNFEVRLKRRNDEIFWVSISTRVKHGPGNKVIYDGFLTDITERKLADEELKRIEWMLSKKPSSSISSQAKFHDQGYGDLTELNHDGIIIKYIDRELLEDIASDYLELLGTSSAIYEANGDYAYGIFSSGWCRMMDQASRDLCNTHDNALALKSGKWLCHESCWTYCATKAIFKGAPADIECNGGIRMYAVPIIARGKVVGAINFGYGDPPRDPEKLRDLADAYDLDIEDLIREANAYDPRPPYIIEMAKRRLHVSARLIGLLVEARQAEEEREKLHSQLLQAQKMESIGILAGGIAHDFDNLLHAMGGNLELLDCNKSDGHPDKKRLKTIQRSMDRATQLIQKLLLFSRKADIQREVLDLNREIRDAAKMLEPSIPRMISIELTLDENAWRVNADPIQVEQVLLNLGANAADAMPEGGRLIIETTNVTLDQNFIRTHTGARTGKYVLITVSDTGCGMDKEILQHIFDPFFTTKEVGKGTGLGLPSVYGIVKAHEGYVLCYSEPGQGTAFKIYWPAATSKPDKDQKNIQPRPSFDGGSGTILVVDDDDEIRDLTREVLENSGYKVLSAESGEQALNIFKEKAQDIDLVLMDLNMPGMGGSRCTREMIRIDPSIRVLVASGYSAKGHGRDVLEFGAKGFIAKPFQMNQLLVKIRELLESE